MTKSPEKKKPTEQATGKESAQTPAEHRPATSLAPYGGWEPLLRLREEFDRMFEPFFRGWPGTWEGAGRGWRWGLHVEEDDQKVVVHAEAPGFEPDDFDLEVRGDQLVLRASHKAETEEKERGYHQWQQQELYRSVTLPPGIDTSNVDAQYRNGVLTVTLPKTEESKGRRITVKG